MNTPLKLLNDTELLLITEGEVSQVGMEALAFAGQLARQSGARVSISQGFGICGNSFLGRGFIAVSCKSLEDAVTWSKQKDNRFILRTVSQLETSPIQGDFSASGVVLELPGWQTEATLFSQAGLADLLGDPEKSPLVPGGNYARGTIGYGVFTALMAVVAKQQLQGQSELAQLSGVALLAWINWKAAAAGHMGMDIHREGTKAEWPVVPCEDGHAAIVFTERDWPAVVKMIGDPALSAPQYDSFKGRQQHRDGYMAIIRSWALGKTKEQLTQLFYEYQVPGAAVLTTEDLLQDPLLDHRQAIPFVEDFDSVRSPVAPHRIEAINPAASVSVSPNVSSASAQQNSPSSLPLAGIRVLDLGIITAGAGTSGILADLGAEVIKIESHSYPDPFRMWAGSSDSPLFKFNNRNKLGVAIDLKTSEGREQFLELARTADVVVENFRRGVLERMGLSFDELRKANPRMLLVSISGQGLSGPGCDHTTFGSTLEASSGFAAQTCYSDGQPYITGRNLNYPDQTVCLYGSAMIMVACSYARIHNTAIQLDVSQRDVALFILGEEIESASASLGQTADKQMTEVMTQSKEGRWFSVSLDRPDALRQMLSRQGFRIDGDLVANLHQWAIHLDKDTLMQSLMAEGITAALVQFGSEVLNDPTVETWNVFAKGPDGALVKGFPFTLKDSNLSITRNAPQIGEHTDVFLTEINDAES